MKRLAAVSVLSLLLAACICYLNPAPPVHAQNLFFPLNYSPGLMGWWKLCGDTSASSGCTPSSSTTVYDSSGYSHNGTWQGTKSGDQAGTYYSSGAQVGPYAGYFDGTDNGVSMTGTAASHYTLFLWFEQGTLESGERELLFTNANGPTISVPGTHKILYYDSYSANLTSTSTITAGQWYCVAITFDGTYRTLYVDGAIQGSPLNGGAHALTTSSTWTIGWFSGQSRWLDGEVNDVRVYNRALGAGEIAAMCNAHN